MKSKKHQILLISLFVITLNNLSFAQKNEYKKVENSIEICDCMNVLNQYLLNNFNDEYYITTRIGTYGNYNNVAIMADVSRKPLDLSQLFEDVYINLKEQDILFEKIRYLIIANNKHESFGVGDAILITGQNFKNHIDDFEALKESAIFLYDTYIFDEDTDVKKILNSFMISALYEKKWGSPKKREKTYKNRTNMCYKRFEKSEKKKAKL